MVDSLHIHTHIAHHTVCTQSECVAHSHPFPKSPLGGTQWSPKRRKATLWCTNTHSPPPPLVGAKALPQHCCFRMFQNALEQKSQRRPTYEKCLEEDRIWNERWNGQPRFQACICNAGTRGCMDSLASKTLAESSPKRLLRALQNAHLSSQQAFWKALEHCLLRDPCS